MTRKVDRQQHTTFAKKVNLRRRVLADLEAHGAEPAILETHGGWGRLYEALYAGAAGGVVFERHRHRAEHLARQRPTWAVYETDCVPALAAGVGSHLAPNLIDLDPYGGPWEALGAALSGLADLGDPLWVVANDGILEKLRIQGAWAIHCLRELVPEFGNKLDDVYLDVAKVMVGRLAAVRGYRLDDWRGYYCGKTRNLTHWAARLRRTRSRPRRGD